MQKDKNYIKLYEKDQQSIKTFDKIYRKSLQDDSFDKSEYESLRNIFIRYVDKTENESFL